MLCLNLLVKEDLSTLAKPLFALCRQITAGAPLRHHGLHLGMALKITLQAVSHIGALRHDAHTVGHILHDAVHEQRIMGAAEDNGVDERVAAHQLVYALLHKIVGPRTVCLVGFHDGSPQRTSLSRDRDVGVQLANLHVVALRAYGALGGQHTHMARSRELSNGLCRGTDHAKHTARGVHLRQVTLLDGA